MDILGSKGRMPRFEVESLSPKGESCGVNDIPGSEVEFLGLKECSGV